MIVRGAALAGLRENAIQLGQRETFDRVVLVDIDRQAVHGHVEAGGLEAVLRLERVFFLAASSSATSARTATAPCVKAGGAVAEPLPSISNLHIRILLAETLGPVGHQVVQGVGADTVEVAGNARYLLVGLDRIRDGGAAPSAMTERAATAKPTNAATASRRRLTQERLRITDSPNTNEGVRGAMERYRPIYRPRREC